MLICKLQEILDVEGDIPVIINGYNDEGICYVDPEIDVTRPINYYTAPTHIELQPGGLFEYD